MRLIMLRHGKTPGNLQKRYIGRTDEPLCAEGEQQARAVGAVQSVPLVYVSPLLRARQTAEIAFPDARQIVVPDLREMDFGDFDNLNFQELSDNPDYRAWVEGNCEARCPHGESKDDFSRRTANAIRALLRHAFDQGDDQVIVVAHGGTIMAAMDSFTCGKGSYYSWHVENCEGYSVHVEPTLLGGFEFEDCQKITTADRWWFAHEDIG